MYCVTCYACWVYRHSTSTPHDSLHLRQWWPNHCSCGISTRVDLLWYSSSFRWVYMLWSYISNLSKWFKEYLHNNIGSFTYTEMGMLPSPGEEPCPKNGYSSHLGTEICPLGQGPVPFCVQRELLHSSHRSIWGKIDRERAPNTYHLRVCE